jgi:D-serine dehydratase
MNDLGPPGQAFDCKGFLAGRPVLWTQGLTLRTPVEDAAAACLSAEAIEAARQRFQRFAPLLALIRPELAQSLGQIESPLEPARALQEALRIPAESGVLLVKSDHLLPMAGSVKARGGTHEVIELAERLATRHGLVTPGSDYRALGSPQARELFAKHTVAVGSTGNLGLAIGTIAATLGFRAEVHMSADAKQWKKDRLRAQGVAVVEHCGDYANAVDAGRRSAALDPLCHFVDDERSPSLFLGYATAASHFATQLAERDRIVDAQHPLFVYLPCGVGGAPAGITFGLKQVFGNNVHCFFAEPTSSPCFLAQMLVGSGHIPAGNRHPSVYDLGFDNRTEADGLAVPRASTLAAAAVGGDVAGVYTVQDETLLRHLDLARSSQGLRLEPSAAAGLPGPGMLLDTPQGRDYLQRKGLAQTLHNATHIAWLTGGSLMPDSYHREVRND